MFKNKFNKSIIFLPILVGGILWLVLCQHAMKGSLEVIIISLVTMIGLSYLGYFIIKDREDALATGIITSIMWCVSGLFSFDFYRWKEEWIDFFMNTILPLIIFWCVVLFLRYYRKRILLKKSEFADKTIQKKQISAVWVYLISMILAGLLAALFQPFEYQRSFSEMESRQTCYYNIKNILMTLQIYANENDSKFPPSLQYLENPDYYYCDPKILQCPSRTYHYRKGYYSYDPVTGRVADLPGYHPGAKDYSYPAVIHVGEFVDGKPVVRTEELYKIDK